MKSEQNGLPHGPPGSPHYEQKLVARYASLNSAVAACDRANRQQSSRHYVMNDAGKEYYANTWID